MKKAIFIGLLCFTGSKLFAQTDELITEEKTSDWVRISVPVTPVARNTRGRRAAPKPAATTSAQQPAAPPKTPDAFDKTNKQVKRFRKEN